METTKPKLSTWRLAIVGTASLAVIAMFAAACSVLIDDDKAQCAVDEDCVSFGGRPSCQRGLCVASNLGPEGCFLGTPSTPEQFANQCSTAQCEEFDNCARLGLCADAGPPPAVPPPDAGTTPTPPFEAPPGTPSCIPSGKNVVVVSGSTALQPFLAVVAKLLAQNSPPYVIAYQGTGSCNGVDHIFNADPNRRMAKDTGGRTNLLFDGDLPPQSCIFGTTGVPVDVGISDVFSRSCNNNYMPSDRIAEYLGPVQPMTFVVPSGSTEYAISSEMGRMVFGRGGRDTTAMPYTDPSLYFVRNSSSGTQQMISRAIGVEANRWWGTDRGGSSRVRDQLLAVAPARASNAVGILSSDFADAERSRLRILAFRNSKQICGYYPDSSRFTRDKRNVRDGHYPIWGPIHLYAHVENGQPSAAAGALVTRLSLARLDQPLLDAVIKAGLVPQCAMKVSRTEEMGPLSNFSPEFQCGCYFEATIPGGSVPEGCQECGGPADCPSSKPACNNGYCELK